MEMNSMIFRKINNILRNLKDAKIIEILYLFQDESPIAGNNVLKVTLKTNDAKYLIYIPGYFRIRTESEILLTSVDMYIYTDNIYDVERDPYNKEDFEKSIMPTRIANAFNLLKDTKVFRAFARKCGDLIFEFENDVKIEILIDRRWNDTEFYRITNTTGGNNIFYSAKFEDGLLRFCESKVSDGESKRDI